MNIFEKRPLSLISCIMLCGFSLFIDASIVVKLVAIGIGALLLLATYCFKTLFNSRIWLSRIASIAFMVSILLGMLFNFSYLHNRYKGAELNIEGTITEINSFDSSFPTLTMKVQKIDGNSDSGKLLITCDHEDLYAVSQGDTIIIFGEISDFNDAEEGFSARSYYRARGYSGQVKNVTGVSILSKNSNWQPDFFARMRNTISKNLISATDDKTGGFLAALIMGDKDALDTNTEINFKLIGISHILALSGMHLVILSDAIRRILSSLRINKKIVVTISTLFAVFYMFLTGCSPSIVRATVMLLITNGLFLLSSTHDTYTTLPLAVVLILLFQPNAVYDVSLWLSALATLGVVVVDDFQEKKRGELPPERPWYLRLLIWLWDSIVVTVFAVIATFALTAQISSTVSALSPISTFLFSAPVNFLIYAGIALLAVYKFIPILSIPIIYFTDAIKEFVEIMASWQWAIISIDLPIVEALIYLCSIFFFAVLILKIKKMRRALVIVLVLFLLPLGVGTIQTQYIRHTDTAYYQANTTSDLVILKDNGECSVIYSGDHTYYDAQNISTQLYKEKVLYLDNLILTSYTYKIDKFIDSVSSKQKVDKIYIPTPHSQFEIDTAEKLSSYLETNGASIKFYEINETISLGKYQFNQVGRELAAYGSKSSQIFLLRGDRENLAFISSGALEMLPRESLLAIKSASYIYLGQYGSGYSANFELTVVAENIKGIYTSGNPYIEENAFKYYMEKEVPIIRIDTSHILVLNVE